MIVRMPAVRKPRLIGAIAVLSLSVARTDEHADDRREHADARGRRAGTARPPPTAAGWCGKIAANAGTPRMIDATSVTSYDSKRSAAIPAQSPTLSPTLSAIVAGLRGSSSGIPASTLPTRSAPTSAALVKMPPPTRRNSASSEPPNPKPIEDRRARVLEDHDDHGRAEQAEADGEHAGDTAGAERDLRAPSASSRSRAAAAVRTLPRTARLMPMKPVRPDRKQPSTNARGAEAARLRERQRFDAAVGLLHRGRREEHDDRERDEDDGDRLELPLQVGHRAFLDRLGDLLHLRRALVLGEHAVA